MRPVRRVLTSVVIGMLPMMITGAEANPDESFFKAAGEGGLAEVAAGKLAESKATSALLKDFGGMMVKDHTTADVKLWHVAADKGVKMPTTPSVEEAAAAERLKLLSGEAFDKAYIKGQIDAHRDTVALFKKEIASGHDQDARQFAQATLPTVQAHLDSILKIGSAAGVAQ
jgi:putative membrane protein